MARANLPIMLRPCLGWTGELLKNKKQPGGSAKSDVCGNAVINAVLERRVRGYAGLRFAVGW